MQGNRMKILRLCRYLGYDSKVEAVFIERVATAAINEDSIYTFRQENNAILPLMIDKIDLD